MLHVIAALVSYGNAGIFFVPAECYALLERADAPSRRST